MTLKIFYIFIAVLVFFPGCENPPTEEMGRAREMVFRAENDTNAVQFAGNTLALARIALNRMEEAADSKNYEEAKTYATEAILAAEKAISDGRAGAERPVTAGNSEAIGNTTGSNIDVSALRDEIESASREVNGARYNLLDLDYAVLDDVIVNAYNAADQIEADQAAGRQQDAMDRTRSVRADLFNINQLVANAVTARKK